MLFVLRTRLLTALAVLTLVFSGGLVALTQQPAYASGSILVSRLSPNGVYFRYVGNTVVYYLLPGSYRSTVQAWTPKQGFRAYFHCAGGAGKYSATSWTYPTDSCGHYIDSVTSIA